MLDDGVHTLAYFHEDCSKKICDNLDPKLGRFGLKIAMPSNVFAIANYEYNDIIANNDDLDLKL